MGLVHKIAAPSMMPFKFCIRTQINAFFFFIVYSHSQRRNDKDGGRAASGLEGVESEQGKVHRSSRDFRAAMAIKTRGDRV